MVRSTIRLVGDPRQPQHDSYGRKVPIWEVMEAEATRDEMKLVEKQASWKGWLSRKRSWESSSTVEKTTHYANGIKRRQKPSWTLWNPFEQSPPSSPYSSSSNTVGQSKRWKPIRLRLPVLSTILVFTLGLIALLEVLHHLSTGKNNENGGGLAFAATADDLPLTAIAGYIYLPTVIAVIYSIIWSWVDLDVKRLEPWFQLSKPEGATAEDSVLLSYPFDFLAFVPVRAARRRHWAVVIAGSTMMLITWAIVPLQSAIFATSTVTRTLSTTMTATKSLISPASQLSYLNSRFMVTAYGLSWLDQQLPAYTMKDYALQPFAPVNPEPKLFSSETWTSPTTMYYTNLTCEPVFFNRSSNLKASVPWLSIFDESGCVADASGVLDFIKSPHYLSYTPWCDGAFLAVWAQSDAEKSHDPDSMQWENMTGVSCRPSYHTRLVTATVNASTLAVISVVPSDAWQPRSLNDESFVLNTTLFEELANNGGIPYKSPKSRTAGRPDTRFGNMADLSKVQQVQKLTMFNISITSQSKEHSERSIVPYALAASKAGFEGLRDPVQLQAAFQEAHQVLFSAAVSYLMVDSTLDSGKSNMTLEGIRRDLPEAVVYVRAFAIAVEACLGVVAFLTCALWFYYRKRPNNLDSDPRAMADIMRLVRSSHSLLDGFRHYGTVTVTAKDLESSLRGRSFRLSTDPAKGMQLQVIGGGSLNINAKNTGTQSQSQTNSDGVERFVPVRPFELQLITGVLLSVVVASAMAILIALYAEAITNNGLRLPSGNKFVLLILTNLIPTAFATLIEPFWVILNRLLCILQPFEDLRNGDAKSSATIGAKYTSLPPQLLLWNALKSKHFLLALVCLVSLSTNILAVALSGLFNEEATVVISHSTATIALSPDLNSPGSTRDITALSNDITTWQSLDQFYVALAYLDGVAKLPPWVDSKYFYMPFDLPETPESLEVLGEEAELGVQGFNGQTRGFGISTTCQPLSQDPTEEEYVVFHTLQNGTRNQLNVVKNIDGGRNMTCSTLMTSDDLMVFPLNSQWSENATSIEWVYTLYNHLTEDVSTDEYCAGMLLAGWVRVDGTPAKAALAANLTLDGHVESTFMACKPALRSGIFDINVDTTGRVMSSTAVGDLAADISQFANRTTDRRLRDDATRVLAPGNSAGWHNTSYTQEWLNTVLSVKLNTTDLVDPSKPVPNVTDLLTPVSELSDLIFAITLSLVTDSYFSSTATPLMIPLEVQTKEQRIFMEPVMFYIAVSLLGLQLITAILYYTQRPRRFLPRLPLSIASIITYISASYAVRGQNEAIKGGKEEARYGYGHYIGVDGKGHIGIELAELVVPLKAKNPTFKRRRISRWLGRDGDPSEPKVWI